MCLPSRAWTYPLDYFSLNSGESSRVSLEIKLMWDEMRNCTLERPSHPTCPTNPLHRFAHMLQFLACDLQIHQSSSQEKDYDRCWDRQRAGHTWSCSLTWTWRLHCPTRGVREHRTVRLTGDDWWRSGRRCQYRSGRSVRGTLTTASIRCSQHRERSLRVRCNCDNLCLYVRNEGESLLLWTGLRDDTDRRVVCEGTMRVVNVSYHSTAVASGVLLEHSWKSKYHRSDVTWLLSVRSLVLFNKLSLLRLKLIAAHAGKDKWLRLTSVRRNILELIQRHNSASMFTIPSECLVFSSCRDP